MVEGAKGLQYTVLGSDGLGCNGGYKIELSEKSGESVLIDSQDFSHQYTVVGQFALAQVDRETLKSKMLFCPLMVKYTGRRYALIAVAKHAHASKVQLAVFQCIESKEFYSLPIDQFYDQFSPAQNFVFVDKPRPIDADGGLGYVVNESSTDAAPMLSIHYDCDTGELVAEPF